MEKPLEVLDMSYSDHLDDLLELADYLKNRSGSTSTVVITNDKSVASRALKSDKGLFISSPGGAVIDGLSESGYWVDYKDINQNFLADKVLVTIGYLEDLPKQTRSIKKFKRLQSLAVFSVVTCQRTDWWTQKKFNKYFRLDGQLLGHINQTFIKVDGKAAEIRNYRDKEQRCLAIVPQYNESDIIPHVINHLIEQGMDVHVIDNWSDDGSYEIVKKMSEQRPEHISVERFPDRASGKYEWGLILDRVSEVAYQKRKMYNWAMLNDADEIRRSPWKDISLCRAFSFIDHLGYNSVDFTLFNFSPVSEGYDGSIRPQDYFNFGEFPIDGWAFLQIKAWKTTHKADLSSSGGHHALIPNQRVYPLKFLLNHYPVRSSKQAAKKIFKDRKPRFMKEELDKGWSRHYDKVKENTKFIKDAEKLIDVLDDFDEKYLLERLSGVGTSHRPQKD